MCSSTKIVRRHKTSLLAAALAIVGGSLLNGWRVPLYDGVSFPDEPYRYYSGRGDTSKTTPRPTPANQDTPTDPDGKNSSGVGAQSDERGPQVYVYIAAGSLRSSAGAHTITLTATPQATNTKTLGDVSNGKSAGNSYKVAATSDKGKLTYTADNYSFIDLRLPQGYKTGATVYYQANDSAAWRPLDTKQVGNDIYEAHFANFGNYALSGTPQAGKTLGVIGGGKMLLAAIGALALLAVVFVFVRLSNRQRPHQEHGHGAKTKK